MGKKLVIVESPAKAKTINKILGKDYVVKASLGHVRDLPPKKLGVDPENGFKPEYVNSKGKEKVIKELKSEAKNCDQVLLAPDPDREGEAIAWHLKEALKGTVDENEFYRVTYNEITPGAIKKAFGEPRQIDEKKVNAQQARRVLDRLVGYQISPLLWRRVKGGASAGRVQTVALRLVCEREREILDFVPEKFWILGARVAKQVDPKDPFNIKLLKINDDKAEVKSLEFADRIRAELDNRKLRVDKIARKEVSRRPQPPFITSTLQQAGSSFFGFTPKRTMGLAQKLYEGMSEGGGLITYMRTDSVSLAADAVESCRAYVRSNFGDDFVPAKPHAFKSKSSAQEAHEAIRPTDITRTPESLKGALGADEYKLYELIWRRTVASQMSVARIAQLAVDIDAYRAEGAAAGPEADTRFLFRANASEVIFPGYMKLYKPDSNGDKDTVVLPPLKEQESLDCVEWLEEEKETQPPARYSEASLIRALEENGVGRPSTYASTIGTITDREYVEKENRSLKPTEVGFKVHDFLIGNLSSLFDVKFTAYMEEELDEIEEGKIEWTGMLDDFYKNFQGWIADMRGKANDKDHIRKITDLFAAVKDWDPPVKRGKRTFSDEKFIQDIIKALDDEKKIISVPQFDVLKRMVCHYREQIKSFGDAMVEEFELQAALAEELKPKEPPRETTLGKLALFKDVQFAEPRKVGKRTYDDKAFCESLAQQVESGKRLSEKQVQFLDRLLTKYSDQVPDFEKHRETLGMDRQEEDNESGPLLELAVTITEWNPPVQRGKRVWSDEEFHASLKEQFERNKRLSERQRATLKKLLGRYADQIPTYKDSMEALDLPEPKVKKPAKKKAAKKKPAKKKAAKKKPAKKKAAKSKAGKKSADADDPEEVEAGS